VIGIVEKIGQEKLMLQWPRICGVRSGSNDIPLLGGIYRPKLGRLGRYIVRHVLTPGSTSDGEGCALSLVQQVRRPLGTFL